MPVFVLIVAWLGDFGFVLGRAAIIFYAIRLGAGTGMVLLLGATEGVTYSLTAGFAAGPLVARYGSRRMMRVGAAGMMGTVLTAPLMTQVTGLLAVFAVGGVFMALFWPSVHTLLVERTAAALLTRVQAVFNVTWTFAILGAFAASGWLIQFGYARGVGPWWALGVAAGVIGLLLATPLRRVPPPDPGATTDSVSLSTEATGITLSPAGLQTFATVGWIANFASFAVYDAVRLVFPTVGAELGFPEGKIGSMIAAAVGAQCVAFLCLTRWRGWLYRRRWFYAGFALHVVGLLLSAVAVREAWFLVAFVCIGFALAFTYASSLFYGLGASATAGHSGGRHEAMIGFARVIGPACGATAALLLRSSRGPFAAYLGIVGLLAVLTAVQFRRLSAADRRAIRLGSRPAPLPADPSR